MQRITGRARRSLESLINHIINEAAKGDGWDASYYVDRIQARLSDELWEITGDWKAGDGDMFMELWSDGALARRRLAQLKVIYTEAEWTLAKVRISFTFDEEATH